MEVEEVVKAYGATHEEILSEPEVLVEDVVDVGAATDVAGDVGVDVVDAAEDVAGHVVEDVAGVAAEDVAGVAAEVKAMKNTMGNEVVGVEVMVEEYQH